MERTRRLAGPTLLAKNAGSSSLLMRSARDWISVVVQRGRWLPFIGVARWANYGSPAVEGLEGR